MNPTNVVAAGVSQIGARLSRDGTMAAPWFLILPLLLPMQIVGSWLWGGWWTWTTPLWVFGIVPVLDVLAGEDRNNPTEAQMEALGKRRGYRWVTYLYVPIQFALVIWGAWVMSRPETTWVEILGLTWSIGICTGAMGITFAHELCHKPTRIEPILGDALLMTVCYMHFHIEHNKGHHVNVATPKDPASSRFGESFWRFYPRTVIGSWRSAWAIETARLRKKGRAAWHPSNHMIWYTVLPLAFAGLLTALFGWAALPFFFVQALLAFSLLEVVNYLEHYGMERKEIAPGKFEKVAPVHSWNSNHKITNAFLIMLQRHSDHHTYPLRRYQMLRHFDESPQLPTGYAGMIWLAVIPPLWFRIMDPKVRAYKGQVTGGAEAA